MAYLGDDLENVSEHYNTIKIKKREEFSELLKQILSGLNFASHLYRGEL